MMLRHIPTYTILFLFAHAVHLHAQHNDIRFDYQANKIDIKASDLTGDRVGVGTFPLGGLFKQFTDDPGFASESDLGLGVNPLDTIVYNVLDDLLYWNGTAFAPPKPSTQIRIENNLGKPETIVNDSSGHIPGGFSPTPENYIDKADGAGDIHNHVKFNLEPRVDPNDPSQPHLGAYGLKLSLSTDAVGIADSDPFFAVFNFGLDSAAFAIAIDEFGALLPSDLAGDYDRNGTVDNNDYQQWQQQYGTVPITSGSGADGNSNGIVDGDDFLIWQSNFGASLPPPLANDISQVPEPSMAAIISSTVCAMLALGRRRRTWMPRSNQPFRK